MEIYGNTENSGQKLRKVTEKRNFRAERKITKTQFRAKLNSAFPFNFSGNSVF